MTPVFSDLTLEYAPWSMSKAALANNCSFSFNLKYVKKIRGARTSSAAGRIGNVVHKTLEKNLNGGTTEEVKEAMYRESVNQKLTSVEMEDALGYMHNIASFKERLDNYKKRHDIERTLVEKQFSLTKDFKETQYYGKESFFKGIWDLVLITKDRKNIVIIDHKSGEAKEPDQALEQYREQRQFYAIGAYYLFPGVENIYTSFHFVQSEEIIWAQQPDTPDVIENEYLPWFYDYLNSSAEKAQKAVPTESWFCSFCNHIAFCPLRTDGSGRGK